jgi:hypothetical protein
MDVLVAPVPDAVHCTYFDEDIYAKPYAKEEHNHLHHFILKAAICPCCEGLVGQDALAVDDFVHHPKHAKHAEGTKERRQVGEPVERRNEPQAADSQEEHQDLLPELNVRIVAPEHNTAAFQVEMGWQLPAYQVGGDCHSKECRQDESCCIVCWGYGSASPYKQGSDVTNDGEAACAVCGNDDYCTQKHPLPVIDHKAVHCHQHDDGRGQVVEVGAQQEAAKGKHPNRYPSFAGAANLRDEIEASVVGQDFHNRHRRKQIHHDTGKLDDVVSEDILADILVYGLDAIVLTAKEFLEASIVKRFDVVGAYANIENPSPYTAKEGDGGLVDSGDVLRANEQVANQHQDDNSNGHNSSLVRSLSAKLVKNPQIGKYFIAISRKMPNFVLL